MQASHDHDAEPTPASTNWSRINQWLLWLGLAFVVGWLFFRHNEHLLQLSPFLVLPACPLMHIFGHGRHGGHRTYRAREEATAEVEAAPGLLFDYLDDPRRLGSHMEKGSWRTAGARMKF